jgi:hypothetical protein
MFHPRPQKTAVQLKKLWENVKAKRKKDMMDKEKRVKEEVASGLPNSSAPSRNQKEPEGVDVYRYLQIEMKEEPRATAQTLLQGRKLGSAVSIKPGINYFLPLNEYKSKDPLG